MGFTRCPFFHHHHTHFFSHPETRQRKWERASGEGMWRSFWGGQGRGSRHSDAWSRAMRTNSEINRRISTRKFHSTGKCALSPCITLLVCICLFIFMWVHTYVGVHAFACAGYRITSGIIHYFLFLEHEFLVFIILLWVKQLLQEKTVNCGLACSFRSFIH